MPILGTLTQWALENLPRRRRRPSAETNYIPFLSPVSFSVFCISIFSPPCVCVFVDKSGRNPPHLVWRISASLLV